MTEFNFNPEETQVRVTIFLPGNCGCNQAAMFMADTDPQNSPGLRFVVLDADAPLLLDRFGGKNDDRSRAIQKWRERLTIIQLGKSSGAPDGPAGRRIMQFGAGGDTEKGTQYATAVQQEIDAELTQTDLAIIWGAGGGGVGGPTMKFIAERAKELQVPFLGILILPFMREGSKVAVAEKLRNELRDLGPLMVVSNEKLPTDQRQRKMSEAYQHINKECRGIFEVLRELTQVVGVANADLNDLLKDAEGAKDYYIGNYKPMEDAAFPTSEEIAEKLMTHTYQEPDIVAKAMILGTRGEGWTIAQQDEIVQAVQERATFDKEVGRVKLQVNEVGEPMAFVIAFGEFKSAAARQSQQGKQLVAQEPPVLPLSTTPVLTRLEPAADLPKTLSVDEESNASDVAPALPDAKVVEEASHVAAESAEELSAPAPMSVVEPTIKVRVAIKGRSFLGESVHTCELPKSIGTRWLELASKNPTYLSKEECDEALSLVEKVQGYLPRGKEVLVPKNVRAAMQSRGEKPGFTLASLHGGAGK